MKNYKHAYDSEKKKPIYSVMNLMITYYFAKKRIHFG